MKSFLDWSTSREAMERRPLHFASLHQASMDEDSLAG
jgi:hypothetical protein